jgi:cytochrome c oxidase cbb3-type subunit 2
MGIFMKIHKKAEKNSVFLLISTLLVVSVGGLIEIAPLFFIESTIEEVDGMRPYTPLEQLGRNVYLREGCYLCHSQMIRPFRDEVERYGHYSLAAESMYDHPFQWGSKRTGPDLARVGGRYSNAWHQEHMNNPRAVVPESVMPAYPFLMKNKLKYDDVADHLKALRIVGVPYTDDQIKNAKAHVEAQVDVNNPMADDLMRNYPKAVISDFDSNDKFISEFDALVAYLQMLGTLVDFSTYTPNPNR